MWQKNKIVEYTLKDIKFTKNNLSFKSDFLNKKEESRYDWEGLEKSLIENGYKPEKYGYITISKDGYVYDGHHRTSILQTIFINDENKKILIKKSILNYNLELFLVLLLLLIFSPILILNFLYKKLKSIFT